MFEADLLGRQGHGDIFAEISGAPELLSVNGPYVRTTDVFNGKPVYAQLNAVEFARFKLIIRDSHCKKWLNTRVPVFLKATRVGERWFVYIIFLTAGPAGGSALQTNRGAFSASTGPKSTAAESAREREFVFTHAWSFNVWNVT